MISRIVKLELVISRDKVTPIKRLISASYLVRIITYITKLIPLLFFIENARKKKKQGSYVTSCEKKQSVDTQ